jgi:peptidoglycan/xylan/chitin deacetylase (PgdA/CDA1 family)
MLIALPLQFLMAKSIVNASLTKPVVMLYFPDGYQSHYDIAKPILDENNLPATFAIITDLVGTTFEDIALMNWTALHDLIHDGYTIHSHTATHPHWTTSETLSPTEMIYEFNQSQYDIKNNTGYKPYFVETPYDEWNATLKTYADDYYKGVFRCDSPALIHYTASDFDPWSDIQQYGSISAENKTGNNTALLLTALRTNLNYLVANGSGYALFEGFHNIYEDIDDCRQLPYMDISKATFEDAIDIILEYRDVGKNITVRSFQSVFSNLTMAISTRDTIMDILPSIISIMMLGVAIAMLTKAKW